MQTSSYLKAGVTGLVLVVLGSCGETLSSQNSFESQYAVARNALERGQYDKARRSYQKLLGNAGPFRPRLQLEYAHTELRAGNYAEAARLAHLVAQGQNGPARGAALAVQGTAQHELGLQLLAGGETAAGRESLRAASAALGEVLSKTPELDPLGSMAARRAEINTRLKRL